MVVFGIPEWLLIFLSGSLFSLLSNYANRKMGIKKKMNEMKKKQDDFRKEYSKALEGKNEKEIARVKEKEGAMINDMFSTMLVPWKSYIVVLPMFFTFMYFLAGWTSSGWLSFIPGFGGLVHGFLITLPFGIHINEVLSLNILHASVYGPRGFFIVSAIISGMIIETVGSKIFKEKMDVTGSVPSVPVVR